MNIFGIYILEEHIKFFIIIHVILSIIVTVFVSRYIAKRYISRSKEAIEEDIRRLEEIRHKSLFFKLLFEVSLHRYNPVSTKYYFFIFNLSMPFIGYFASLWVAYYLVHVKYEKKFVHTNILNLDEFSTSFLKVERIFGEGSMSNIILNENVPKSKKLKALSTLSANISPLTLRIIKQTLSSKNDEIRMYGYATINKVEKRLNEDINHALDVYKNSEDDDEKKYEAAKSLAFSYWEMIYTELSHESLRESFLKEVEKYLRIAKDYYLAKAREFESEVEQNSKKIQELENNSKENKEEIVILSKKIEHLHLKSKNYKDSTAKLFVLNGRVFMGRKNYEAAITEFTVAQELSESDSSLVLPYLAEIYFIQKNYTVVQSIMHRANSLGLNPKLYPIVKQWNAV